MSCEPVTPLSAIQGTFLNSRITSFDRLAQRIAYQLGAPLVTLEAHINAINEFIAMACERYTKYAGFTQEYLVFHSSLYEIGKGIRMDVVFSISPQMYALYNTTTFTTNSGLSTSATVVTGLSTNAFDYDLNNYRKVVDCFNFEEGESSGINTLFTLEQSMAQQTYFAYSQGNYGFDLVTWYTLKEWLKLREKVLATIINWQFDPDTQYLRLLPEPRDNIEFWGTIGAWVERPLYSLVKEPWVQDYALALTKIAIGHTRGKFAGTQLFGGGTINYQDMLSQGITEKQNLEQKLLEGAAPGYGDGAPPSFFVG